MEEEHDNSTMPLLEHLKELRRRLIITVLTVMVCFGVSFAFSEKLIELISLPVIPYVDGLHFDTLTDPFFTHMKTAFYTALFTAFPVIAAQFWLFISPGLLNQEKSFVWPFVLISYPLFVGGALFFYFFVFPYAVEFLISYDKNLLPSLRVGDYISFSSRLLLIFGLVFELPLISFLLTRIGVLRPHMLTSARRYSIVIMFIVAAILTPPDVITQAMMALPLIILYEISIIVCKLTYRGRQRRAQADSTDKEETAKK